MKALARALHAEALKLRGTLAAWMCLIAPGAVVVLYVLQMSMMRLPAGYAATPDQAWLRYMQSAMGLWLFLMLPLLITLLSALLAQLEHADRHWKHLLALPVPRGVHFLAKILALAGLVLASFVAFLLLLPLGGMVLMAIKPALGMAGAPDPAWMLRTAGIAFLASLLIVALQAWVAMRWRSFTVAVSFGMVASVAGLLIGPSVRWGHWFPWTMPLQAMGSEGLFHGFVMWAGVAGGALVALLATADLVRRELD